MAINSDKFLPPSKSAATGGALVAQKPLSGNLKLSTKKINLSKLLPGSDDNDQEGILASIAKQVFQIRDLVLKSSIFKKKQISKDKIQDENENFAKREKKLEEKPSKEEKSLKVPSLPKLGFLDYLKNFIFKTLIGYFVYNLIPHLPKLINFVKNLTPVFDFLVDMSGKLFNGLVSFIDGAYKAIDATRGFIKSVGGEFSLQIFDNFTGAIEGIITATITAALALSAMSGGDGGGGPGGGGLRVGGKGAGRVDPRAARRYAERFGRDAALKKFGKEGLSKLGGKYARSGATNLARKGLVGLAGKGGAKMVLGFARPLLKRLPIIGALIDFGLSVALKEDPGRAAFKAIGAGLLGFVGAAIGGPFAILTGLAGGAAGDWAGGALYDAFFGGKKPKSQKPQAVKAAGGGITRGNKPTGGKIGRTVKRSKRTIRTSRSKVNPGKSIGGEKKLKNIFPEVKDKSKKINPYGYMKSSYEKLSSASAFGGLFALPLKAQLGEQPSKTDYQNAASGLNSWMQRTFSSEIMRTGGVGFAEGGKVEAGMFSNSEDMTKVIEKSLEDSISSKVTASINDLKKQLGLKPDEGEGKEKGDTQFKDGEGGEVSLEGSVDPIELGARVSKRLMKDFGLSDFQAAGVSGNFLNEGMSQGTGDMREGGVRGVPTYNGPRTMGYGWAQWTNTEGGGPNDRLNKALIYLGMKDKPRAWTNEDNYKVLKWELQGPYKSVIDQMKNAKSVDEATMIWLTKFEGINDGTGPKRINSAKQVLPKIAQVKDEKILDSVDSAEIGDIKGYKVTRSGATIKNYSQLPPHHDYTTTSDGRRVQDFTLYKENKFLNIPVPSPVSGKVSWVGNSGSGGNWVEIQSNSGKVELGHFNKITAKVGQSVQAFKTVLGLQGHTGKISPSGPDGTHVHIQAADSIVGRYVNTLGGAAYLKGGRVSKPTRALIGEKGPEFIFDADTTRGLDRLAPLLLEKLNAAKTKPQLASILQSYAPYERSNQEIVVQLPPPEIVEVFVPMPMGGSASYGGGSGSDPYDSLAER